ncbi:MAG TPA: ribonuclease J, partial [Alphaproteobacteria bacterium]|nr:ribonuclease J [Alphaproteobacteria bacterium]
MKFHSLKKDQLLPNLPVPRQDEVLFCALGGIGEIGMNAALYGHDGKWIMVDCGITFADDQDPGVDVILPDLTAARLLGDRLLGIVLTHAHEDHLGAVPYLGPDLGVPVFATPFTATFLKRKLQEDGQGDVTVRTIEPGGEIRLGPFQLRYIPVPHSIPEAQSLTIRSGIGTFLHTGDWKTDPAPVVGKGFKPERFRKLGEEGVLAMFCDSTNAMVEGRTGSEAELATGIAEQIAAAPLRAVFTCFASNIARLATICRAAAEQGRHVALVGRSLRRMHEVAQATGYWPDDLPGLVEENYIGYLPREQTVIICTGSQGEAQAALARMATGAHPHVNLEPGDTVIYSSRDIPGNDRAIGRIRNRLIASGVHIVTDDEAHVHVSGHPARDELRQMYELVQPKLVVPCHGETAHLFANEALAKEVGVPAVAQAPNGTVLRIKLDEATEIGRVRAGRQALDGARTVAIGGEAIRTRRQVLANGAVMVSAAIDRSGDLVADLEISLHGLTDTEDEDLLDDIAEVVEDTIASAPGRDIDGQTERIRTAVRRLFRAR